MQNMWTYEVFSLESKEEMNVWMSDCIALFFFFLFLSATARINSQWHSIVLLGPVSANQWSELFAGFCLAWVTFLEGKLKFARQDATPPLLLYVWPCSHHPSVSFVLPAAPSALLSLAIEKIQGKSSKCVCKWSLFTAPIMNPNLFKTM